MKKMKMFWVAMFMVLLNQGYSQSGSQKEQNNLTYKILNAETVDDVSSYIVALDKADMSSHRLRNNSNIIKFESGLEVEIFSAQTLLNGNLLTNDLNFYLENFGSSVRPTFKLGDNDFIIELHSIHEKK